MSFGPQNEVNFMCICRRNDFLVDRFGTEEITTQFSNTLRLVIDCHSPIAVNHIERMQCAVCSLE